MTQKQSSPLDYRLIVENSQKLKGAASDREFFRVDTPNSDESIICMKYHHWNEGHGGKAEDWLTINTFLQKIGIPVPKVVKIDRNNTCIWIEDLGDGTLKTISEELIHENYIKALKQVHALQKVDTSKLPKDFVVFQRAFDYNKLRQEMALWETFFLKKLMGPHIKKLSKKTIAKISFELDSLCHEQSKVKKVMVHRDFHSENLLANKGKLFWIDFQDMMMGSSHYDLVSLIFDPYVTLSEEIRQDLIERHKVFYLENINSNEEVYQNDFMGTKLQRLVKILGSYAYLSIDKNKPHYADFINPTLQMLSKDADLFSINYPELVGFLEFTMNLRR